MNDPDSEWRRKGATLSNKTAQEEFGLTWEDIVRAIRAGKLLLSFSDIRRRPSSVFRQASLPPSQRPALVNPLVLAGIATVRTHRYPASQR
jgi:hypothetical protein